MQEVDYEWKEEEEMRGLYQEIGFYTKKRTIQKPWIIA